MIGETHKSRQQRIVQEQQESRRVQVDSFRVEEKPLDGANKGAQMLQQMGWRAGEGLGSQKQGITAPVDAIKSGGRTTATTKGLGLDPIGSGTGKYAIRPDDNRKTQSLKKTAQRYESNVAPLAPAPPPPPS
jgi:hypothetical protein